MKTKIVYVLVSDSSDYYYEQTLISATSARMWNSDAEIVVVVDDKTNATFDEKRKALFDVATRKIVVELPSDMNKKRRSRILKTTLREWLDGDFIYIDSDTVVCGSLADVDSFDFEIGAVLDRHMHLQRVRDYQVLAKVEAIGGTFSDGDDYFNGGVFFVKDTARTHEFFRDWHELYLHGLSVGMDFDQPSLLMCNQKHRLIHLMDGVYNCQIFLGGLPYLGDARIIHAFNIFGNSSFFLFNDRQFLQKIKEQGRLTPEDEKRIEMPKRQFQGDYLLFYGDMMGYPQSSLFHLYNESPGCFRLVEKLGSILLKFNRNIYNRFSGNKVWRS